VDKGEFKDPIFKAASALWFDHSMRAQHKQWAAKREYHLKRMEQLEQAFRDAYRVPIELIEKAAFTTATDTLGGHLVPDPVEAEMNRLIADNSILRQAGVRTIPMVTKTLDLPKEGSSSLGVAIENEGAAITDSVPASNAVAKVTLTAKRFDGYAAASLESIQDSAISVLTWVQEKLTELIGTLEDTQALEGTSSFTGLAADTDVNEIAAQTNGDAITYAKLVSIVFKARQRTSRQLARFFMAPEAMAKVVGLRADAVTAADGAGVPIFQFGNVPGTIQMTLLGFPVEVHSGIRIDRTKGSGTALTNIYFGPPRQITFGDRTGMSWDVSDVASMVVGGVTTSAFQTYSVHMRLIKRTAIAVAVGKAFTRAVDLITT
jgi:HK97 family phage major capsid protein